MDDDTQPLDHSHGSSIIFADDSPLCMVPVLPKKMVLEGGLPATKDPAIVVESL